MIVRALLEGVRTVAFQFKRRALHERAIGHRDGTFKAARSGFIVPEVQEYTVTGVSGDYRIFVTLPSVPPPQGGFPVLYLLDGNAWIAGATEVLRLHARFAAQSNIEPMMIVAVGYPGTRPIDLGRRAYDFLPPHRSRKLSERFMQGAPWHQPGGADAFQSFLTGRLREAIAERYPVNLSRQVLCGHSFGGFFTLYSLLTKPGTFQKYVALSPSLWWDDGWMMKQARASIAALPSDLRAQVLIALGDDETPDRPAISRQMTGDAIRLVEEFSRGRPPGLVLDHRILCGENHQSVPATAFPAVLRFVSKEMDKVGVPQMKAIDESAK